MPAQKRDHHQSAFWLLIILTSSVFLIEILLMVVLEKLPAMSDTTTTLLDALFLSILLFPIFYYLVFRPLILSTSRSKKAEDEVRNALEELRHQKFALDQHAIVGVTDVRGTILYANDQFCAISGYARDELLGQDHRILNSGIHPKEYFREMYHTIAAGNVWHGEFCNKAKDGHLYWVDTTIVPYMDEHGKPIQYISMRTDITERKQAESNLKKSEELWKFALEGSGDGVWDWNFQTGEAKFSKRWKEMLGFTEAEIANSASEWKSRVHPDDLSLVFDAIQAHMDGKTPTAIIEFRMLCKDGSWKWILGRGIVVSRSSDGKPLRLVGTNTDITERKRIETALKESEIHLHTIIQSEPECIKIIDSSGNLVEMNPAGLAMLEADSVEQLSGSTLLNTVVPEYRAGFVDMHKRVLAGESVQMEFEVIGLKGAHRWLHTSAVPMQTNGKSVLLGVTRDITSNKQMEEQVRHLAFYDPLTNLPNRRLFNERLSQSMAASKRTKSNGAVMFIDLDNFKPINDTHGHTVGDLLLIDAANRIKGCLRGMDTVARFGGDEFVVMLSELDMDKAEATSQARLVAEKILATLSAPYLLEVSHDGQPSSTVEHNCTASIGVAIFINHEGNEDDIIKWADSAMYRAKKEGRNQIRLYESIV